MRSFYGGDQRPGLITDINYDHPCAKGAIFACVFQGGRNTVDVVRQQRGTPNGTGTQAANLSPYLGACASFDGTVNSSYGFTGRPTVANQQITIAAFIMPFTSTPTGDHVIFAENQPSSASGFRLQINPGSGSAGDWGISGFTSRANADVLVPGVPYFLVGSVNATTGNSSFVSKRLDTGKIVYAPPTTAFTPVTMPATSGAYGVGSWTSSGPLSAGAELAAVFVSNQYYPKAALLQWAENPWAIFDDGDIMNSRFMQAAVGFLHGGAFSGTLASTSSLLDVFQVSRPISGTSASATALQDTFRVARHTSGTTSSVSSASASWKITRVVSAVLQTVTGWLSAALQIPISLFSFGPKSLNSNSSMRGSLSVVHTPAAPTHGRSRGMSFPPGKTRT